jgi:hypothetical protein
VAGTFTTWIYFAKGYKMGFSTQEFINRMGRRPGAGHPVSIAIGRAAIGTGTPGVRVEGLERFKDQLAALTAQMRRRVLGNALRAGAREIRDTAKRNAPVLSQGNALKGRPSESPAPCATPSACAPARRPEKPATWVFSST